ncbi:coiled-coil domain containing protein [Heterostelium album PN500]|uniref:DNA-directed primase/polymerase protein n=1 Tax=Heterostelium pallidum (strain ATCC 26659 / Pp 5 / PN500) TaxID=670386 RepID=D3BE41_HETP5|nr:coiled-coil domain containing protein [Heterostelium album PN500]EFA80172.1 coiled-coil domain containing protein [Heterostelium album PN500]|eukprot:XP_020432292.1 coiled-coil domain containing protein [Heterostelium album PN500]
MDSLKKYIGEVNTKISNTSDADKEAVQTIKNAIQELEEFLSNNVCDESVIKQQHEDLQKQGKIPSDWEEYLASIKKANNDRIQERNKLDYNPENDNIIKTFAKQKDALETETFDNLFEELDKKTFSREVSQSGSREFIVSKSYQSFWNEYRLTEPKNHYELIEENEPCHLYFDIEYQREYNPQLDGRSDKVMEVLYYYIILELKQQLNIDSEHSDVLELDSSTPIKFSKHLIWHLKQHCFKSNEHVGRFIKIEKRISLLLNHNNNKDDDDYEENDIDYSQFDKDDLDILQEVFMASLITNIDQYSKPISVELDPNIISDNNNQSTTSSTITSKNIDMKQQSGYPKLDNYIRQYINSRGGKNKGYLRSITKVELSNGTVLLRYYVGGNRYCENIQREHKSQHIYLEANLTRNLLIQRCFDVDCKHFKSSELDISSYL